MEKEGIYEEGDGGYIWGEGWRIDVGIYGRDSPVCRASDYNNNNIYLKSNIQCI